MDMGHFFTSYFSAVVGSMSTGRDVEELKWSWHVSIGGERGGGTKQTKKQQPATNEVRCDSVVVRVLARKVLASKS